MTDRRRPRRPTCRCRRSARCRGLELLGVGLEEAGRLACRFSSSPSNSIVTRDRQRARHRLPGAAGLDEGHQLAFVVGGAAAEDHHGASPFGDHRLERRGLPELQRIDRLHVVVPEEQRERRQSSACLGRPPSDARGSAAPRLKPSAAGPRQPLRRPAGIPARHRPGRSRSSGCAAPRTAGRGPVSMSRSMCLSTSSSVAIGGSGVRRGFFSGRGLAEDGRTRQRRRPRRRGLEPLRDAFRAGSRIACR